MAWWNVGWLRKRQVEDHDAQAMHSEWVPTLTSSLPAGAASEARAPADDAAVFLDRVYTNQDC